MNNPLKRLFSEKKERLLNVYCTAGYPEKDSLAKVIFALQQHGADMIEIGMPYSDPLADGPVIQNSNKIALQNGMTIPLLFAQLHEIKNDVRVPIILMGYVNPVLQYGMERFCADAAAAGISGIILPDLPMREYEKQYKNIFAQHALSVIFLITPQTSIARIKIADALSSGFVYAVSSAAITGALIDRNAQLPYFKSLRDLKLKNPLLIGFGISDKITFDLACEYAAGAITGSAYIKTLGNGKDISEATKIFIDGMKGRCG